MTDSIRQQIAKQTQRVVIKVGTRVLTHEDGRLNTQLVALLSQQLAELVKSGKQVALVSSGAVGAGLSHLGWDQRPADVAQLQAVAAIGQTKLIEEYDRNLATHGRHAAQLLLTAADLDDRRRYLNVRNTLLTLLSLETIPIINENDTVIVDELMTTFGDNDRLAAAVTNLLRASLLIILSDIEGLYDGDPTDSSSQLIGSVDKIDEKIMSYVRDKATGHSKGGMASKIEAARALTATGENVIVACGHDPTNISRIFRGEAVGTLFAAQRKSISPFKRWLAFSAQTKGTIIIDSGAERAVLEQGRSLLPIGIKTVRGDFRKGDVISIVNESAQEIARGMTNYDAKELAMIVGVRSEKFAQILGHHPYDEAIHRDNLSLTN